MSRARKRLYWENYIIVVLVYIYKSVFETKLYVVASSCPIALKIQTHFNSLRRSVHRNVTWHVCNWQTRWTDGVLLQLLLAPSSARVCLRNLKKWNSVAVVSRGKLIERVEYASHRHRRDHICVWNRWICSRLSNLLHVLLLWIFRLRGSDIIYGVV